MKIIYISNARFPTEKAHGLQIAKMCQAFGAFGIDVELILPRRKNYIKESAFSYYGLEESFKIKRLLCLDLIPWDKHLGRFAFFLESFTFYFFLFFYLLFKRADVFYTREFLALPFVFFKRKVVLEAHTLPKHFYFYRPCFKKTEAIVVITEKLKELFVVRGVKERKIVVAPDGVDIQQFNIGISKGEARGKLNLPQDKQIIVYTGHLYPWKGADVLLEAARLHISREGSGAHRALFVFVGGTERDISIFKEKSERLKAKNVLIAGHRPHREIPLWLKAADVLVLPNSATADISKYWTSPLKMFEYMASRRPIVASSLPSLREVLNENNAFFVKPDSPRELALKIEKVLKNPAISAKIAQRALRDVEGFSWERRAQKIMNFLKNL